MKTFGYIATFIGGAIAGAAVGLLLAPEKGSDTRSKIADTVDELCEKQDNKLNRSDTEGLVDDSKEAVDEKA